MPTQNKNAVAAFFYIPENLALPKDWYKNTTEQKIAIRHYSITHQGLCLKDSAESSFSSSNTPAFIYAPFPLFYLVLKKAYEEKMTIVTDSKVPLSPLQVNYLWYRIALERYLMGSDVESFYFLQLLRKRKLPEIKVFLQTWLSALAFLKQKSLHVIKAPFPYFTSFFLYRNEY